MSVFSQEIYKETLDIAAEAHGDQKTPHGFPYVVHITSVTMEVIASITEDKTDKNDANLAIQCALLHDVLEDTDFTEEMLKDTYKFDSSVIAGVKALTKDTNLPSKQDQMKDSLQRLLKQPKAVQMVKLADRITNLGTPPKHWNEDKIARYKAEAQLIHDTLKNSSNYLSSRLQDKIDNY